MARLTFDVTQLAELAGAAQGLLLVAALLAKRTNRTAHRLLAALMASFTLYLVSSVYYSADLVAAYPHFFGVSYPLVWLFGPLVYLYAKAASDRAWRLHRRDLWHFAPFAITTLSALPYLAMSGAEKLAAYQRLMSGDVPWRITVLEPTKYISGLGYSLATMLYLRRHQRRIEESYSNTARVNLRWLLWLGAAAAAIWLLATVLKVTDFNHQLREDHISLAVAVMVYAIGYMGFRQPEVFRYETAEQRIPVEVMPEASRYERSGLGDDEAATLESALRSLMDEQAPWKDSELTLADLASRLGTTPHKVSEVLNARVGQTFHDFVNGYRVREVQRRIATGDSQRFKMLALAHDAGFASKSTFNDAFKRQAGMTPSAYRESVEVLA